MSTICSPMGMRTSLRRAMTERRSSSTWAKAIASTSRKAFRTSPTPSPISTSSPSSRKNGTTANSPSCMRIWEWGQATMVTRRINLPRNSLHAAMSTKKKIRFGVIGCSRIEKKAAIPALLDWQYAELAMVGSQSYEHAKECAQEFGCKSYGTYDEVLADKDIDAVYISLPNSLHEEWAVKAAEAGRHVWCEKPAALTYASAKKMVSACRENKVRLMEGFMFLSHPQQAEVRRLLAEGAIGEPRAFEGSYTYPMPKKGNIRLNADLGGGVYNDAAVYPIRASRMLFNDEPLSVTCKLTIDPATNVDVKAEATLDYPDDRTARILAAFDEQYLSTYRISGAKGRLSMERA